uniref:Uncharacterized protein n=1 Tax=Strongyloides venezuelensis TaxID=75913 RepID=A0A0K0FFY9_STRVS
MIATCKPNYVEDLNYMPSKANEYPYFCQKKFSIKDSLKHWIIFMIPIDCLFLFGMFYITFSCFLIHFIFIATSYLLFYVFFSNTNVLEMLNYFIFNQFINNVYAMFNVFVVIFVRNYLDYSIYYSQNDEIIFTGTEKIIIMFNIITICCKVAFMNHCRKTYILLLWQREHVNKLVEIRRKSLKNGNNNNHITASPKVLVVPVMNKNKKTSKLTPIPIFNTMKMDIQGNIAKPIIPTRKLSIEQASTNKQDVTSHIESFDYICTPDFYQVPLKTPPFVQLTSHSVEMDRKNDKKLEDDKKNNLPRYYIAGTDTL